ALKPFCIVIPPPNVTGVLHMGHGLQGALQDALTRYHRMVPGTSSLWLPGTDHAGIATQNVVKRNLREKGTDPDAMGREDFVAAVWKWKEKHGGIITRQWKQLGASCDWDRERFTLDEGLARAVRECFVRLWERGLIYRGKYIVNWCPRCNTAISDEEVEHKETDGHLWYIKYPLEDSDEFLVVGTTRPETMLGDTAVAIHPDDGRYRHLKGKRAILPFLDRRLEIVFDDWVDPEFGTGAVKVTPAHDPNDFEIARRHGLAAVQVIDEQGRMTGEAGQEFEGLDRFECRRRIVERLEEMELLDRVEDHHLAMGHCHRCSTVIEPLASDQLFVKMEPLVGNTVRAIRNGDVRFYPERWARIALHWLDNMRDWCISRQLWWGHRIPMWTCEDCGEVIVSREDPTACTKCAGSALLQHEDVLDTWFSSWLWPFSTMGWPDETEDMKYFYPTTVLVSGYDIIFFWITRMIIAGLEFTGKAPFRDVYITGMITDEQGRWMSKSLGNGIDPLEMINEYGADAVRASLVALATAGQDIRLSPARFEMGRKFCNKIWNAYRFLRMNVGDNGSPQVDEGRMELADRWILSRFQTVVREVDEGFLSYRLNESFGTIYRYFWHEYCDWYLELIKDRIAEDRPAEERAHALGVALRILEGSMALLHPVMPFITEEVWQGLGDRGEADLIRGPKPEADAGRVDAGAEAAMGLIQSVVHSVRETRWRVNYPLTASCRIMVRSSLPGEVETLKDHLHYLRRLARIDEVIELEQEKTPEHSIGDVIGTLEVFVPVGEAIDLKVEVARLEKERDRIRGRLEGIRKKLENTQFVEKAPGDVVEAERKKERDAEEQIGKIERTLDALR
ncbi:MAG: valine--tRNA ligase, partial [Candidatus Eisenbacteria sp.]|nr:valine--tRNA ligase [Candidatus Eisenbacteria bacterium]